MLLRDENCQKQRCLKYLGVVHRLCLEEKGISGQKCQLFVNFDKVENVNRGGKVVKNSKKLVNIVCE